MNSLTQKNAPKGSAFLVIGWLLIAAKCVAAAWAVAKWNVPINVAWVIWPTVLFGALITGLWCSRERA